MTTHEFASKLDPATHHRKTEAAPAMAGPRQHSACAVAYSPRQAAQRQRLRQLNAMSEPAPARTALPETLRAGMQALSGVNLTQVQVHYNSSKPAQLQAHAYAQGNDIHLAPGQERYLPHEAWHLVQQRQGRVKATAEAGGVAINDNPGLEREADQMGERAAQMKTVQRMTTCAEGFHCKSSATAPVQRVINIAGEPLTKKELQKWKSSRTLTDSQREKLNKMRASPQVYDYASLKKLGLGIKRAYERDLWYQNGTPGTPPGSTEKRELSPYDPLHQEISAEIMENHKSRPYATDALHENGPVMGPWLEDDASKLGRVARMAVGLLRPTTHTGTNPQARPGIEISKIVALRNQSLMNRYGQAKADIEARLGPGNAREQSLYSGHRPSGMDFIEGSGHDPSYGTYDSSWGGKGHGAHGRGAYFTDRVDKAVSYSAKNQGPGEERSFFKQDVLLGNPLTYSDRGRFRHRHHNEMVRARNPANKTRAEGQAENPGDNMAQYDSLIGAEDATTSSGNGLWGTIRDRKKFDSTEYMVRNADQILPRYRIHYRRR